MSYELKPKRDLQRIEPCDGANTHMQAGNFKYYVPVEGPVIFARAYICGADGSKLCRVPDLSGVRWGWDADGAPIDSGGMLEDE